MEYYVLIYLVFLGFLSFTWRDFFFRIAAVVIWVIGIIVGRVIGIMMFTRSFLLWPIVGIKFVCENRLKFWNQWTIILCCHISKYQRLVDVRNERIFYYWSGQSSELFKIGIELSLSTPGPPIPIKIRCMVMTTIS